MGPVITSATTATATVGTAFSYQITATNSPTGYLATGLPAGLSLNTTTGLISGSPTTAGTAAVTITAINAVGSINATLTITISNPASSSSGSGGGAPSGWFFAAIILLGLTRRFVMKSSGRQG